DDDAAAGRLTGDLAADQDVVDLPPPRVVGLVVVEPDLHVRLSGRLRDRDLLEAGAVRGLLQHVRPGGAAVEGQVHVGLVTQALRGAPEAKVSKTPSEAHL